MTRYEAIVLLSGGLDSVYNLYAAEKAWPGRVKALHIQYGQKAASQEERAARFFANLLEVPLQILDLRGLFSSFQGALTSSTQVVPTAEVDIQSLSASQKTAAAVWVPNRNGVFLNVAAAVAENEGVGRVIPGFNREEAATFADNSGEFLSALNLSLSFSTRSRVQVECFSLDLDKRDIFRKSAALGIPLDQIWSCYEAGQAPCGQCESCQRFERGLRSLQEEA